VHVNCRAYDETQCTATPYWGRPLESNLNCLDPEVGATNKNRRIGDVTQQTLATRNRVQPY